MKLLKTLCALAILPTITAMMGTSLLGVSDEPAQQSIFWDIPLSLHRSYTPGLGSQCYGVWTEQWTEQQLSLPPQLLETLNATSPALLERIESHACPYGRVLPGDVTLPLWNTTDPVASFNAWKGIAVFYSYVPVFVSARVVLATLLHVLRHRRIGTLQLFLVIWLLTSLLLQELVLKRVVHQPRPGTMLQVRDYEGRYVGSCSASCGMPSSHSMYAVGWFALLLFDRVHRVRGGWGSMQQIESSSFCRRQCIGCLRRLRFLLSDRGVRLLKPWLKRALTPEECTAQLIVWAILLLPVPVMRVVLYDHTVEQAILGSVFGMFLAAIWWRLARDFQSVLWARGLEGTYLIDTKCVTCGLFFGIYHDMCLYESSEEVTGELDKMIENAAAKLEGCWIENRNGTRTDLQIKKQRSGLIVLRHELPWPILIEHCAGDKLFVSFNGCLGKFNGVTLHFDSNVFWTKTGSANC